MAAPVPPPPCPPTDEADDVAREMAKFWLVLCGTLSALGIPESTSSLPRLRIFGRVCRWMEEAKMQE